MQFCPRCGLANVQQAARDNAPLQIKCGSRVYRVLDRIAIGSISTVYHCRFRGIVNDIEGVFKIARDACANDLVANEARILTRLRSIDVDRRFSPFFPELMDSLAYGDDTSAPPRQANVMRLHDDIRSPDELYTLEEVRQQYSSGLDERDMAWIWRRLLTVLGFAHSHRIAHGAVLPVHVLIEPREHKLVLVDWCSAVDDPAQIARPRLIVSAEYQQWYAGENAGGRTPTPALDVALAARCMIDLVGGDPVQAKFPASVDSSLQRYFKRCVGQGFSSALSAWRLLDDFDSLIDALWGPRKFRTFAMPPKGAAAQGG